MSDVWEVMEQHINEKKRSAATDRPDSGRMSAYRTQRKKDAGTFFLSVAILLCFCWSPLTQASEATIPVGPIGGTDIGQAIPLPSGIYLTGVGVNTRFDGWYAADWDKTIDASGHSYIAAGQLMYVFENKLWGGTVSSSIQGGYSDLCLKLNHGKKNCSSGMVDSYSDVFSWAKLFPNHARMAGNPTIPYGLAVRFSMGLQLPIGEYDRHKTVNVGANFWDIVPSVALTYTGPSLLGRYFGEATEYSGRLFYHHYTKNDDTDYDTADVVSLDFALTQRMQDWQYGIAGYWFSQIDDDTLHGDKVSDKRSRLLIVGPIVQKTFVVNDRPWIVAIKAGTSLGGTNTGDVSSAIIRVTTKL
ncbi:transporter [Samsonia erythrinae]|uniref:Uncharacterized protein n=1 Tax=Samsonia erythrinae TaxID=160434 RepID=A0A4R3VRJ2_9GAMM|nr:transporter [Samsonia erythrinae]TCV08569.1 hypothetical protein EDC54_10169 [Samsonia erythrinae]